MSHIFNPRVTDCHWTWITMTGPDAADFLHRLTTVNIKSLAVGTGKNGCFLSVQGKVRAFFKLWRLNPEQFAFELDAGLNDKWRTDLLGAIEQYTFSEKFSLENESSQQDCRWLFLSAADLEKISLDPLQTRATIQSGIRICHQGILDFGKNWVTAWGAATALRAWTDDLFPGAETVQLAELEKWRINQVRPWVDHEITDAVIPLEIGLTDAIAENKGCYPGQEVIEKISTRGAAPRKLIQIQGLGLVPQLFESVLLTKPGENPVEIGQLTSVTHDGNQFSALAIVRKMHAQVGLPLQFETTQGSLGKITHVAADGAQ